MSSRLASWFQQVTQSAKALLELNTTEDPVDDLVKLAKDLLSRKGEATGLALASSVVNAWQTLDAEHHFSWFERLLEEFNADTGRLNSAIAAYQSDPTSANLARLHVASEPTRQELFRRINAAPGGLLCLIKMREILNKVSRDHTHLRAIDSDFSHLFSSWFNKGFLTLKQVDWNTPAHILEKLIQYESVHEIQGWQDLRRRLADDRRCFAYFHPVMPDEPLIFVEVALVNGMADAIAPLLAPPSDEHELPDTAVFYSINNCQPGLSGISFGNLLIKQVTSRLQAEHPSLRRFVTLSPVPGFRRWVESQNIQPQEDEELQSLCAFYLTRMTDSHRPLDPVARFHLGNGARLERINLNADTSAVRQKQSFGVMVNYLYELDDIVGNHERLMEEGELALSKPVLQLVKTANAALSE